MTIVDNIASKNNLKFSKKILAGKFKGVFFLKNYRSLFLVIVKSMSHY